MKTKKISIIWQVAAFFLIGIVVTGILTYVSETGLSYNTVKKQSELRAEEITEQARRAVMEYPAYEWLIRYWYAHPDTMEIEYDAEYGAQTLTEAKCRTFSAHQPQLQLKYLQEENLAALPEEDQKLYAEIAYSWLITRINQIKQTGHVDYLFCVISEDPFDHQFFLFSGADPGAVRGNHYEEVYLLGNVVEVTESQQEAMKAATQNSSYLADAGNYLDYYSQICEFDGHSVMIGLTYDLSALLTDIETKTRTGARLAILNQIVLSLICLSLLYLFLIGPLKKVQKNIRQYTQTKDSRSVVQNLSELRSRNEIGELSADVMSLAEEIDSHLERIQTITAEKERISAEMSLANSIQTGVLPTVFPPFPDRPEIDIFAVMEPAKEVGGDFYDFFLIDQDHLALVIADVSGKGVPAALFMMASKIILQSCAMMGQSAAETLTRTNEAICSNNREDMFVTAWFGILELSTGKLTASNAGHEYPVIKKPDGAFELYNDKHGFVIGGFEGVRYKEYEVQLEPGSKIFVYTDGVPEATDHENNLFGTDRMLQVLNADPEAAPEQLLKNVRAAVDEFVGHAEQFDDLTMLCLEYHGGQPV